VQQKIYSVECRCDEHMLIDVVRALTALDVTGLSVKHQFTREVRDDDEGAAEASA